MKIRTKLQLVIIFTIAVFSIMLLLSLWMQKHTGRLNDKAALIRELNFAIFERVQIRDEYFIHTEERSKEQWFLMHKKIEALYERMSGIFTGQDEKAFLDSFAGFHKKTGDLFNHLVRHDEGAARHDTVSMELRERIVSQMMVASHSQYLDGLRLRNIIDSKVRHNYDITRLYTNISFGLLSLVNIYFAAIMLRSVTYPLLRLQKGTEIIADGRLDYKTDIRTPDEFGRLSEAFDLMTERLKTITVSRDELVREAEKRADAERETKRYSNELKRSNEELQSFAYIASHDLQEPLRTITSFLQLVENRNRDKLDGESKEFMAFAVDGAKRLQSLINSLLEYSRIGSRDIPSQPVECEEILRRTLDMFRKQTEETGAVISHGPLPVVNANPSQLGQVFQNLIGNAIKYRSEEPPRIHISAQQVTDFTVSDEGVYIPGFEIPANLPVSGVKDAWLFSVKDNGIGIDLKYKDRLFVVFQRLHSAEKYAGTGIGLAICRRIIERHGGRIWFDSKPGKGSTFYFILPQRRA